MQCALAVAGEDERSGLVAPGQKGVEGTCDIGGGEVERLSRVGLVRQERAERCLAVARRPDCRGGIATS